MKIKDLDLEKIVSAEIAAKVEERFGGSYWTELFEKHVQTMAGKFTENCTEEKVLNEINSVLEGEFINHVGWGKSEKHGSFDGFVKTTIQKDIQEKLRSYDLERTIERLIKIKTDGIMRNFIGDIQSSIEKTIQNDFKFEIKPGSGK